MAFSASESDGRPVVTIKDVTHRYGDVVALDGISLEIPSGRMVGIIGPDGVGKSTLMALIAGSKKMQEGRVSVLGGDIADAGHRHAACPRIAYMPQGLGKNLYLELSVQENVDFMARLFGLSAAERPVRIKELLDATGLGPFPGRPAGKLSGGMKQKVGLCGALVHEPDLLILDEPTTGVDPLSRRQFWTLIDDIRAGRPSMSVLISTAYMDEAQKWDWIVAMDAGRVLATGTPAQLMQRTGTKDLEQCFIALLPEEKRTGHKEVAIPPRAAAQTEIAIDAKGLTKRFGSFTAVDHVTLSVERGEIFGFLGSNGCGKSTTMKMLTGLLPPSEGSATLFGQSVEAGSLEVRENLGYMTQAFSLWGELTVRQNLVLDARLYHIPPDKAKTRIEDLVEKFGLGPYLDALAEDLPLGMRQRLSLAVAVLHNPQMLILDEPTSGVDPVARDSFWELLIDLSRRQGVTIFITTHFMNEGMRCDRISLMNAGKVLACDVPQKLIEERGTASLEDAFIAYMEDAIAAAGGERKDKAPADAPVVKPAVLPSPPPPQRSGWFSVGRMLAYTANETMQIRRDPVRLAFAFVGSLLLMLVFGFGITTDVEHIRYATFDLDQTPESRTYLEQFAASNRYFTRTGPVESAAEALRRLQSNEIALFVEIPPNFGRNVRRDSQPEVSAQVDGANPYRGETVSQYAQGVHNTLLRDPASGLDIGPDKYQADIEERFTYNPTFESIYSIVPSVPALLLVLIPAILMAVSVVREKELGSIINFYVTPTGRLEYLLGKQLPYIVIGMMNFFILVAMALVVFGVPIKGSFLMLTLCTLLYVATTTGIGTGYIKNIINDRIASFLARTDVTPPQPINLVVRRMFNPNGISSWFTSVVAIINQITLLTVVLTGAAVIREREHGTLEHLLVMPLSAFEIAMAKVWANGLVILIATAISLFLIVRMALQVPFAGSIPLWFAGVVLYLFFTTALGIFLGTISRSMAQFALLIILVILVLMLLSGGNTPVESQPRWLQYLTFFLPSRHFVSFSQVIIYRGGGLEAVWPNFVMVSAIGLGFFIYSLGLFRKSIAVTK